MYLLNWNGNVSTVKWRSGSDPWQGYNLKYDDAGRLYSAAYGSGDNLTSYPDYFNENLTYDAMGNVTSLKRRGPKDSGAGLIDDLTMEYDGNRLVKCDDAVASQPTYNAAHHFQDLADSAVEYEYDGNGNMTKDLKIPIKREQSKLVCSAEREEFGMKFNREITSIEYNSLNLRLKAVKIGCTSGKKEKTPLFSLLSTRFALSLPEQITFYDGTKMKLTYDAAGNKLRAEYWTIPTFNPGGPIGPAALGGGAEPQGGGIVGPILPPINQNDPQVVTDYCGNLIYRNDTLSMLLTEEGYVTFATDGTPTYHYYLKDHLGSVRVVLDGDGTVEQVNDYYPSGTLMYTSTNGTVQPYKFGQKELERTLPLDEYDFGARWMDPTVGARFTTMDPLCEKYYGISPYAYCGNNPVNAVDPDGRDWFKYQGQEDDEERWHWHEGKSYTYTDVDGKEQTINNGYEYLSVFVKTGTNDEGASTGSLLLFHQQYLVAGSSSAFSGGKGFTPIEDGEYYMNLSLRKYNSLVTMVYNEEEGWNPEPFWGLEQFPNGGREIRDGHVSMNYPTRLAYGNSRIRLTPFFSNDERGLYIHGKSSGFFWTHGCLCDKSESIQKYFISGGGKNYRGIVPLTVFNASSLSPTDSYVQFIKSIIGW